MGKMNPVDTGFRRPLDGTAERSSIKTVLVVAMGVAAIIAGGALFYTL
jgi:hypothetical protein